tara:strand:+ start:140 stop:487 length:348 start_codon:yes stop_codon:yes gene_type:complete
MTSYLPLLDQSPCLMQNDLMIRLLNLLLIMTLAAGCEMPQYSAESADDKYPAEPYQPKDSNDRTEKNSPSASAYQKKETKQNQVMQDADKPFSEAQGNLIKGKARKPSPNENLLK